MMFNDYFVLTSRGADLLRGQYADIYPLSMTGWFALWSLIPSSVGLWLWLGLSILALVTTLKRKSLWWIFYFPIIDCLFWAQVDLWFLWLASLRKPIAYVLMTLKPQLFLFALPALIADRTAWRPFALWCIALYLPITIARPTWIIEWLSMMDDGRIIEHSATTLIYAPVALTFIILIVLAVMHRLDYNTVITSFNPFLRQYDLTMLAGKVTAWIIPLSWLAYLVGHKLFSPWPVALLGLLPREKVK